MGNYSLSIIISPKIVSQLSILAVCVFESIFDY